MNFDLNLNDNSLLAGNSSIFNGGEPGRVKNVTFEVVERAADEPSSRPDYNFTYTDASGASVKEGYYKYSVNPSSDDETNARNFRNKVTKLLSMAKVFVPNDFVFPDVTGMQPEAIEALLINTIKNNVTPQKTVNVYVTYGTKKNPSGYLRVRYNDFIEPSFVEDSKTKLVDKPNYDNMVRVAPDSPATNTGIATGGFGAIPPAAPSASGFWGGN